MTMADAPASRILRSVGKAARMRRSLVMFPEASSGTLKSTRTRTFFPRRSVRSSSVFLAIWPSQRPINHESHEIHEKKTEKDRKGQKGTAIDRVCPEVFLVLFVLFSCYSCDSWLTV